MPDRPTRTVTFLLTDIEGSTKLWQQYPDQMPDALARHHAILNEAVTACGGYVFQIIGDAFYLLTAGRVEMFKTTERGKVVLKGRQPLLDGVTVSALRVTR
jgi:class 3 adenylate cyclase